MQCVTLGSWEEVDRLIEDSGNGTVRLVLVASEASDAQRVLDELASVGCTYERASSNLVAVTVPPTLEIPFSKMANYLNDLPKTILIGWEVAKQLIRRSS